MPDANDDPIEVYGASWCPDRRRAKRFLANQRVHYLWHDIDGRDDLQQLVEDRNGGKRIIPTIVFPDGIGGADLAERFVKQAQRYGAKQLASAVGEGAAVAIQIRGHLDRTGAEERQ